MRLIRSILSGTRRERLAEGAAGPEAARELEAAEPEPPLDEAARERELEREFEAGLSELARRQLRYARDRREPPSEIDPRGSWLVTEPLVARTPDGRNRLLEKGTQLTFVEAVGAPAGPPGIRVESRSFRFCTPDGALVDVTVEGVPWPEALARPGTRAGG